MSRMRTIIFELSMPNSGSWNGQWSGAAKVYRAKRRVTDEQAQKMLKKGYYHYNFGDGWSAGVRLHLSAGAAETAKLMKPSSGFCGYDWMVDAIVKHDRIIHESDVKKEEENGSTSN